MTMDTRDPNTNISELKVIGADGSVKVVPTDLTTTKPTIKEWRAKKADLDKGNDVSSILGCVGEPLADWLDRHVPFATLRDDAIQSLLESCKEVREDVLQMINEHRNEAYEQACEEIVTCAEECDVSACIEDLNGSTTLDEVAEAGRDEVVSSISGFDSNGLTDLTLEDLG